ncbi:TetR/AcrR family transcriptional regulator [Maricurvus nonylphenolicus]|uniref:TetR/AcrR family transcriptional regulator n=1 Tax=Maricurvus nonylphenolicus TaxID=1008307 RepID=UPI0036F29164
MAPLRDPDITRQRILGVAAEEFHLRGYKATSLSDILTRAEVSKGALYHHFPNKQELGYAVLEEAYINDCMSMWRQAMAQDDIIKSLGDMLEEMRSHCVNEDVMKQGCPVNNIAQEMTAQDAGFQQRISAMYTTQAKLVEEALNRSIAAGYIRDDIDPEGVALFIISCLPGMMGIVKATRSKKDLEKMHQGLLNYLETLRAGT